MTFRQHSVSPSAQSIATARGRTGAKSMTEILEDPSLFKNRTVRIPLWRSDVDKRAAVYILIASKSTC